MNNQQEVKTDKMQIKTFFLLDLPTAGFIIGGLEVIGTVFALLSWIGVVQARSYIALVVIILGGCGCGSLMFGIKEVKWHTMI